MIKKILLAVIAFEVIVLGLVFLTVPAMAGLGVMRYVIPGGIIAITVVSMLPMLVMSSGADAALRQFRGLVSRDFDGAPIAIATLVDTSPTGMSINDVPQYQLTLDVETAEGQQFRATCTQPVPHQQLASMTPGVQLPVVHRPDQPGVVELAPPDRVDEAQVIHHQLRVIKGLTETDALQIAAEGTPTVGVVLAAVPTGEIRHGQTGLELTVAVTRPDGSQFTAHKATYLPPAHLSLAQPGSQVQVSYLPHDESRFTITVAALA